MLLASVIIEVILRDIKKWTKTKCIIVEKNARRYIDRTFGTDAA